MIRECMICMEETKAFVTFPCGHEVCEVCFPKVMSANPECPLCRLQLVRVHVPVYLPVPAAEFNCFCRSVVLVVVLLIGYVLFGIAFFFSKAKE